MHWFISRKKRTRCFLFQAIALFEVVPISQALRSSILVSNGIRGCASSNERVCLSGKRHFALAGTTDSNMSPIVQIDGMQRVFCLSDLHTDNAENMQWLRNRLASSNLTHDDMLIVAGDISHEFDRLEESLQIMRDKCQVFFLPGNHEAWLARQDDFDSLEKLARVQRLCRDINVHVDPLYLTGRHPLWIVPLQSWYDGTLSFNEEMCHDFGTWPWVDFQRCRWSRADFPLMSAPNSKIPHGLVDYFHDKVNAPILSDVVGRQKTLPEQSPALLTVSHFLPNLQCLPDWKNLDSIDFSMEWLDHGAAEMSAKFAKVAGSSRLDQQIRSLQPYFRRQIHVFGHSHRPKDFHFHDIRYIHNPLGKPRERELYMVSPDVAFQPVWDIQGSGEVMGKEVVRFWEESGGGKEALRQRMERVRPGRYGKNR
jgi:predicted phosphodiesterase